MLKKVIPIILLLTLAGFIAVFSQVPKEMTYQGVLTDASGTPLSGNYQLTFRIYDVVTGGSALWTEIHTSVDVSDGLFRVHLGTVNPLDLPFDIQYFVSVQVENETELGTRMRLTSVGYSYSSITADSAITIADNTVTTNKIADEAITQAKIAPGVGLPPSGTAGGDLTGTYPNPTVDGLRGNTVSTTTPSTGQVLEWSGTEWAPGTDDSGGTPSGTAGGDLAGTYPNPTVDGLRGRTVATTAPTSGQVLEWSGTQWAPGTDDSGGTPSGTAGGDLAGTYPNPTVDGLRGRTVATTAPGTGQVLEWSGTQWAPGTDDSGGTPSGTAGGDLAGTYPNPTIANNAVNSAKIQNGQVANADIADNAVNSAKIQDNTITAADISTNIVSSVEGVTNDGGNINLIGSGITITGNDAANTVTFTAPAIDGNTLDEAYDEGGAGAGRTITADAGAVNIAGAGGLETSGQIDHNYSGSSNALHAEGSPASGLAMYYIRNNYAGNGYGISAGMNSTSASASSYGIAGWNYGLGYGIYGWSLNSSGYGTYGINSSTGNYGYLGGPSYGSYGYHNSGNYGYMGGSGVGAYGYYSNGNYGYLGSSTYGSYAYTGISTTGTVGSQGRHGSTTNGTDYYYTSTMVGVVGSVTWGRNYHSGVQGTTYANDTGNRTSGVHGIFTDNYSEWGALAYQNSSNTNYGVYATGGYGSPIGKGQASVGIGIGSWGDLFGADIHGNIYGIYAEGNNYALYSNGTVIKNDLDVHLQETESSSMSVLYTNVSTDVTVQTSGYSKMSAGKCQIEFDDNFKKVVSDKVPVVVTITPIGDSKGVFVSSVDKNGFAVVENDNGKSNVDIAFIAIGRRTGFENPTLPQEVISSDYTNKLARGLHNDADTETDGEGLYYENGKLYVGTHYSVLPAPDKSGEKLEADEENVPEPAKVPSDNQGAAPMKSK